MAQARMPLVCLVLLVVLGLVCGNRSHGLENKGEQQGEREEGQDNPYVFKKEDHERRLATESGEILAVPIFREACRLAKRLENFELNIIRIKANCFMHPHFSTLERYLFVREGKAKLGFVYKGKLREDELEKGSLYFIPKGSLFYAINNDNSQNLVLVNLLYNPDPYRQRHHDSFYVGGGRNPPTLLNAFSRDVLQASFKTEYERIQRVITKQDGGVFAPLRRQQKRDIMVADDISFPMWPLTSRQEAKEDEYEPINLQKARPIFSNNNGRFMEVDRQDFRPLEQREERQDMAVSYTILEPGKMTVPHWNTHSIRIAIVIRGHGKMQIAAPEGVTQQQTGCHGSEGEYEEKGEDFKLSYSRVENNLQPDDVFIIPSDHPSVQFSSTYERLEILSFLLNDARNSMNFLAGKNSVLTQMHEEFLAASFNVDRMEDLRMFIKSQNEEFFVDGPQGSEDHSVL